MLRDSVSLQAVLFTENSVHGMKQLTFNKSKYAGV